MFLRTTALCFAVLACLPAAAAARVDRAERQLIGHVNAARAAHGLGPVQGAKRLHRAADAHSRDMLRHDFFDHTSSDGTPFDARVRRHTRRDAVGEALAIYSLGGGPQTIVRMWMNSPPHRAILLGSQFQRIGVSRRVGWLGGERRAVYTADFASRR